MDNSFAIRTKNLNKHYGSKEVLKNINLEIPKGTIFGLIGRNGAGKTTFMKTVLGLINKTSGDIEILGSENLCKIRSKIGAIIETPTFYDNMSAFNNLKYRALLLGIKGREINAEIERVLKEVDLYDEKNTKAKKFSLGMRQRLGIATALMGNPEVLMLDEPINGLDPVAIKQIREVILNLSKKGVTIIISSHILGEMEKTATYYAFIEKGELVKEISKEELEKSKEDLETYFINLIGGSNNE